MNYPLSYLTSLKKLPCLVWGGFLALSLLVGCMDDEEYSLSPTDRLTFSTDTLSFDTIISGQPTNTYTFEVYNHGGKALRLPTIFLEKGAASDFCVNVDGVFLEGGSATDFEIGAKDSLRVFLFANIPAKDSDTPVKAEDKLVFVTEGGVRQEVVLTAYSQDVISLKGLVTNGDMQLSARRPYVITDSLVVSSGTTLTLSEGVRLYFHPGTNLIVHGTLKAEGTVENPVQMRGDRLGYMFSEQPYDRIPGQWGGVVFTEESFENHLNHCDIHSGTFGLRCDSSDVSREKLYLENSIVHNVSGDALRAKSSKIFVGNSQLTNAGGNCVTLLGGDNTFVHCTIANFYAFSGGRGVALSYSNTEGASRLPLHAANFLNCIITGYSIDEIMGAQSDRYQNDAFNFLFRNCLLCTPAVENENIQNCLWDNDEEGHEVWREKNFLPEFDLKQLIFTFGLDSRSQAVGTADPELTRHYYPTDRLGKDRLKNGHPDMGCYQSEPEEKPLP